MDLSRVVGRLMFIVCVWRYIQVFSRYSKVTFMSVCVYRFLSGSLGFFWVSVGVYCFCLVSLGLLWNSKDLSQKIFFGFSVDFSFYLYHVVIIT